MGVQITVAALCLLFGTAAAKTSMVELTREWKPNFGWEVVCTWKLYTNDSLQSVRLYQEDKQFLIYRPERDGPKRSYIAPYKLQIAFQTHCSETGTNGVTGKCIMTLELLQPVIGDVNTTFGCEVSGERPTFRTEMKTVNIEYLVPPSEAVVEKISENDQTSVRLNLNCTSTGLPAPNLVWTIRDQKIPADFSGNSWNFTTKLYHVWSSLSYTPDGAFPALCTPETVRAGQMLRGLSTYYNAAGDVRGTIAVIMCLLIILALTRM